MFFSLKSHITSFFYFKDYKENKKYLDNYCPQFINF